MRKSGQLWREREVVHEWRYGEWRAVMCMFVCGGGGSTDMEVSVSPLVRLPHECLFTVHSLQIPCIMWWPP